MKPSTNGHAQPDLVKLGQEEVGEIPKQNTQTSKRQSAESRAMTDEEFGKVVELFAYLRRARDEKVARADAFEPESCAQSLKTQVEEKVG